MNRLLKKMIDLIKEEHNVVNDKLTGILFLESFKFNFIPKLKNSIESLENYAEISEKDNFSQMYGKDASFIDPTNMMNVARTMNNKFLQK